MKQTRKASLVESLVNVAVGYSLGVAVQLVVLPLFGVRISLAANAAIGVVFSIISIARSFALRRTFEALRIHGYLS
jgi:hypothetical protein